MEKKRSKERKKSRKPEIKIYQLREMYKKNYS